MSVKESQTTRILALLRKNGTVTNVELQRIAWRYSARIHNLRQDGHVIVSNHVKDSRWEFTLQDEAA